MNQTDSFTTEVKQSYTSDALFAKVLANPEHHKAFTVRDGLIWVRNHAGEQALSVPMSATGQGSLHSSVVEQAHQLVGHFGPQRTEEYVRRWFWWPKMHRDIDKFCRTCQTCLTSKGSYQAPAGVLHTLPIPTKLWQSMGMDFISPFPKAKGSNYLWVVVCRLTSMVHLIPVNTRMTATDLSWIYLREVVHLHGLPSSIVSDRDSKFTSKCCRELHRLLGAKLLMSMSFHPQTDGLTERMNRSIAQIFRGAVAPDQLNWLDKIPMVEFAINSSVSATTGYAPFEVVSGYMPEMIRRVPDALNTPPGIKAFAVQALGNIAAAHDSIIASRVFQ